jgi:hypothetical protein
VALGNSDIDQAVISANAAIIAAAKGMLVRMIPTSGVDRPRSIYWRFLCRESVN